MSVYEPPPVSDEHATGEEYPPLGVTPFWVLSGTQYPWVPEDWVWVPLGGHILVPGSLKNQERTLDLRNLQLARLKYSTH